MLLKPSWLNLRKNCTCEGATAGHWLTGEDFISPEVAPVYQRHFNKRFQRICFYANMTQNAEKVQRKDLHKKCKSFSIVRIDIQFL